MRTAHVVTLRLALVGLAMAFMPVPAAASDVPLFGEHDDTPLSVELRFAQRDVMRSDEDDDPVPGEFLLEDGTVLAVKVSARGKSRRAQCDFDPLWIDFKKKDTAGTIFAGQNKLKLVTHCAAKYARKDYMATEYLVYRLFNLLTDASFRVRPLNVTYVDNARDKSETRVAFFIEHKKGLAKRLGVEIVEVDKLQQGRLDMDYAALVAVFQLMVANTDYSMLSGPPGDECCHNVVPIDAPSGVQGVPYDFDSTGFVDPPYAAPIESLGIRRLSQRLYRGYCAHNDQLAGAIAELQRQRDAIYELLNGFTAMPAYNAKRKVNFVDAFYEILDNPKQVQRKIIKKCR